MRMLRLFILLLCLPVLMAQSDARSSGQKLEPDDGCIEGWVKFTQTGAGIGNTLGIFVGEPLFVIEANVLKAGTLSECFEWGNAGEWHVKYTCSDRWFRINSWLQIVSTVNNHLQSPTLGQRSDATTMVNGDFMGSTSNTKFVHVAAFGLMSQNLVDVLIAEGDYIAAMIIDFSGTTVATPSAGSHITFTSLTCTRGTPP